MSHHAKAGRCVPAVQFGLNTLCAAVLAVYCVPQAAAQANKPAATLSDITVSVGRGSDLEKLDVSTQVLTRDQVMSMPETSVDQILNKIPGIFSSQVPTNQLHPTAQVFSMRGFGQTTSITTLVMVDGIPINDPYFRILDWSQIPKDSIERIEILRGGGATSLWGNMAMGGIINIVTREPVPGEKLLDASYGSFNTKSTAGSVGYKVTDTLNVGVNLAGTKSDGYTLTPAQFRSPYMSEVNSNSINATISAYYTPSADSRYYVKLFGHSAQERGLTWYDAGNNWKKYQVSAGGTTRLSDTSSINTTAWYNKGEMDTTNASLRTSSNAACTFNILNPSACSPYVSQIEQAKYDSVGGSAFYQKDFPAIKDIKIGVDARRISSNDSLNLYSAGNANTSSTISQGEHQFQGLFVQGTWTPSNIPMDVTVGLREDFFQTRRGTLNGVVNNGSVNVPVADKNYTQFDPRIGAKYYFANGFDVRAAAYKNFAAPGMNQMYRSFVSGSSYTATSPNLEPQSNIGKEIGFDFKRPGIDISGTVFYNNTSNFIDFAALCTTAVACNSFIAGTGLAAGSITRVNQYVNAGDGVVKGYELLGSWQATDTVQFNGGFVRTMAYLTSSPYAAWPTAAAPADPVNVQLGQVPAWTATIGSNWQATSLLKVSTVVKGFPSYWNNTGHTQVAGGATLVDLGFIYKVDKKVEIYGMAQNLFSRNYFDSGYGYTTMNGSTLSTSTIPSLGMPFNMTLGVRTSF